MKKIFITVLMVMLIILVMPSMLSNDNFNGNEEKQITNSNMVCSPVSYKVVALGAVEVGNDNNDANQTQKDIKRNPYLQRKPFVNVDRAHPHHKQNNGIENNQNNQNVQNDDTQNNEQIKVYQDNNGILSNEERTANNYMNDNSLNSMQNDENQNSNNQNNSQNYINGNQNQDNSQNNQNQNILPYNENGNNLQNYQSNIQNNQNQNDLNNENQNNYQANQVASNNVINENEINGNGERCYTCDCDGDGRMEFYCESCENGQDCSTCENCDEMKRQNQSIVKNDEDLIMNNGNQEFVSNQVSNLKLNYMRVVESATSVSQSDIKFVNEEQDTSIVEDENGEAVNTSSNNLTITDDKSFIFQSLYYGFLGIASIVLGIGTYFFMKKTTKDTK